MEEESRINLIKAGLQGIQELIRQARLSSESGQYGIISPFLSSARTLIDRVSLLCTEGGEDKKKMSKKRGEGRA